MSPGSTRISLSSRSLRLLVLVEIPTDGAYEEDRVRAAIRGGATLIQLRGKHVSTGSLVAAARGLLNPCREAGVPLFVNDRPDVALVAGADGVHIGPRDLPPDATRRLIKDMALGVSARTPERVRAAETVSAEYIGCGALRTTPTKPEAPEIGLRGIADLVKSTHIPVVAVGGIRPEDAPALRSLGAAGMAVMSGVMNANDPEAAARSYAEAWESG